MTRMIIISDSHLFESKENMLFGVNTYAATKKLTDTIRQNEESPDLLVVSGDLSEDGQKAAYQHFHNLSHDLAHASIWFKGNHDCFENIPKELQKTYLHQEWHADNWCAIFLDSSFAGEDSGVLNEKELNRLEIFLKSHKDKFTLVFLHHQPLDVGSEFIDVLGLKNKSEFWRIVTPHQNIRGIVFGHVHQVFDKMYQGIRLLSTPSTSMQFKPYSTELKFDVPGYGYRTMDLGPEGELLTQVRMIVP